MNEGLIKYWMLCLGILSIAWLAGIMFNMVREMGIFLIGLGLGMLIQDKIVYRFYKEEQKSDKGK